MITLSKQSVISQTCNSHRHYWKDQLTGVKYTKSPKCFNKEGTTLSNTPFYDMRQQYAEYDNGTYSDFSGLKQKRNIEMNSFLSYIRTSEFIESIQIYVQNTGISIEEYFQKLFSALLNANINELNKLLQTTTTNNREKFICSTAIIFGIRGKTSWLRYALARFSKNSTQAICCSKDAEIVLIQLALLESTIQKNTSNKWMNQVVTRDFTSKVVLKNKEALKKLRNDKDALDLNVATDRNNYNRINQLIRNVQENYQSDLILAVLSNMADDVNANENVSSDVTDINKYIKRLKEKCKISNSDFDDIFQTDDIKNKFYLEIQSLQKKINNIRTRKKNLNQIKQDLTRWLNTEIFNSIINEPIRRNIIISLREYILEVLKVQLKKKYNNTIDIPGNMPLNCLNYLFPFLKPNISDLVNSISTNDILKHIPYVGENLVQVNNQIGFHTIADLAPNRYIIQSNFKYIHSTDRKSNCITTRCYIESSNFKLNPINSKTKENSNKPTTPYMANKKLEYDCLSEDKEIPHI